MTLENFDIHELLPQREPFIAIGKLLKVDDNETVTSTLIKEDSFFVEKGYYTTEGIIENIAQTCAARTGYINKILKKEEVKTGFIGAIRNMEFFRLPAVGETIVTIVRIIEEVFGMMLVEASVDCDGETFAKAEMKIALAD